MDEEDSGEVDTPIFDLPSSKVTSRVIVRSDIIHERDGKPAKFWGEPHAFAVESHEAAFEREMTVGKEWVGLDLAWVKIPSLLYLKNLPAKFKVNPTLEQQAEADARVVEIGIGGEYADILLQPGRDCYFEPGYEVYVSCRKGQTQLLIVAVPR